jgi:hypothetical protein
LSGTAAVVGTNRLCRAWSSVAAASAEGENMNVAGFVCIADEELMVRAMRDAQLLLTEHINDGACDAEEAISQLLEILDRQNVVAATNRLCSEYGLRPVKRSQIAQKHPASPR